MAAYAALRSVLVLSPRSLRSSTLTRSEPWPWECGGPYACSRASCSAQAAASPGTVRGLSQFPRRGDMAAAAPDHRSQSRRTTDADDSPLQVARRGGSCRAPSSRATGASSPAPGRTSSRSKGTAPSRGSPPSASGATTPSARSPTDTRQAYPSCYLKLCIFFPPEEIFFHSVSEALRDLTTHCYT